MVGDWLNYGIATYGKRRTYALMQEATELGKDTLYAYRRVAERVKTCNRVRGLSWRHHQAVECLSSEDQQLFLAEAKNNKYTVAELEELLKAATARAATGDVGEPAAPATPEAPHGKGDRTITVKMSSDVYDMLEKVAESRGYTGKKGLSEYIADCCRYLAMKAQANEEATCR